MPARRAMATSSGSRAARTVTPASSAPAIRMLAACRKSLLQAHGPEPPVEGPVAVLRVARHRMAERRAVHADLVGAAGAGEDLRERHPVARRDHRELGHRRTPRFGDPHHPLASGQTIAIERKVHPATPAATEAPAEERDVPLVEGSAAQCFMQCPQGAAALGDDEAPRGLPVEPVHELEDTGKPGGRLAAARSPRTRSRSRRARRRRRACSARAGDRPRTRLRLRSAGLGPAAVSRLSLASGRRRRGGSGPLLRTGGAAPAVPAHRSPAPRPAEGADAAGHGGDPAAPNAGSCRSGGRRSRRQPSRTGPGFARGPPPVRTVKTVTDWNCGTRPRLLYSVRRRGTSSRRRGSAAILSHIAGPRSEQPAMRWRGCRSESAPGEITARIEDRPSHRSGHARRPGSPEPEAPAARQGEAVSPAEAGPGRIPSPANRLRMAGPRRDPVCG